MVLRGRRTAFYHPGVSNQTRTRRKAGYFGAFRLARTRKASALLRPSETKIPQNLLALRSEILKRADFCSAAAKTQEILYVFPSILTMDERKSAVTKRGSGFIARPKEEVKMTIRELGQDYLHSASLVRCRAKQLQEELKHTHGTKSREALVRRIRLLQTEALETQYVGMQLLQYDGIAGGARQQG